MDALLKYAALPAIILALLFLLAPFVIVITRTHACMTCKVWEGRSLSKAFEEC